jgi:histidinol-phosphate aminotransferase
LRLAYAITAPALAAHLVNLQPAWAIPGPVAEVLAALPGQKAFLQQTLSQVRGWAAELARILGAQPTGIHFFTVEVPSAQRAAAELLACGIRVRDCTSFGLPHHVRIATRLPAENQILVEQWRQLARQW